MLQEEIQQYSPYTPTKLLQDDNDDYFEYNNLSPINPIKTLNFDTQQTIPNLPLSQLIRQTKQQIGNRKDEVKKIEKDMKKYNILSEEYLCLYNKKRGINKKIVEYERELQRQKQQLDRENKMKQDQDPLVSLKFSFYFNNRIVLNHTEIKEVPEQYDQSTNKKSISNKIYPAAKSFAKPIKFQSNTTPLRSNSLKIQFLKKDNPQKKKSSTKISPQLTSKTMNIQRKHSFFKKYSRQIDELQWKHNLIRQQLIKTKKLLPFDQFKPPRYCYF